MDSSVAMVIPIHQLILPPIYHHFQQSRFLEQYLSLPVTEAPY